MAQNETWLNHDMLEAVRVQYLDGNLFSMDNAGNLIGVNLTRDGVDYSGGGSVSANVIRADGSTVAVVGALSGNVATVVLPQSAYAVPGVASIVVKLTVSGEVTTIAAVVANVYLSSTDSVVDPGIIIPSVQALISAIESAVASIPADYSALWASLAPAFSTSTNYTAGQYVTYNGALYRFTTDHSAGAWNSAQVTATNIGADVNDLKSAVSVQLALDRTVNLFDVFSVAHGKAINQTALQDNASWNASDYIPVTAGDTVFFYATGFSDYTTGYRIFFDFYQQDGTWISHTEGQSQANFINAYYKAKSIVAPNNAYFVRIQYNSTVLDSMNIMVTLNDVAIEYIPYKKITGYPVNKNSNILNVITESDLGNAKKSINLFDERKKIKNCGISNRNAFPKKWCFDKTVSGYCALNDILYLNASTIYRFCVMNPASGQTAPEVVVYAFDSNDMFLASANIGQAYSDSTNGIVYRRFKISDSISVTADHYRLQFVNTAQDNIIQLVTEANYDKYYHPFNELPYAQEKYIKEYIQEKVENTTSVGSNLVTTPQRYVSGVSAPLDDMTAMANGIDFDHDVGLNRCKLVNWFSHDSSIVIYDGKIYCACVGNKNGYGDSPSYPDAYAFLSVVNVEGFGTGSIVTNYDVAKKDDSVGSKTIISGVGVPNIVLTGSNKIRVFFSAKLSDNVYYMMYRDFDPSTNTFGDVTICNLSINGNTYDFTTPNVSAYIETLQYPDYFISMNAMFGKSGSNYYCGMCVGNDIKNSVILTTTNLETFSIWLKPEFDENCDAVFEGACICIGDYLYYALRQENTEPMASNRKMLLAKIRLADGEIIDQCYITDALSRPCWYYDGTDIYLIHNIVYRQRLEFIKIDTSNLINSNVVCIAGDEMIYPWIVESGDYLYFSATGASSTSVYLRRASKFNRYTCKNIESKIASALRLNDVW